MVRLEKITHKNVWQVAELSIFEWQYPFVASVEDSLTEAYVAVTSGVADAYPFAVCDDETIAVLKL